MPEDASALIDLASIVLWAGAFALASLAYLITAPLVSALDVSIAGLHPFRGIGDALQNAIVEPADDLRKKSEAGIAKGISGLLASLELVVGLTLLLGDGVKLALQYLWNHALGPFVHSIVDTIRTTAESALAKATGLEGKIAADLAEAKTYAETQATRVLTDARAYADNAARDAEHLAESYADDAVAKLRSAETAALDSAVSIVNSAVKSADEAAADALAAVKAVAIPIDHALPSLDDLAGITGAAALIAAIPAIASLVNVIVTEAGLGSSECRAKNKAICGVSPSAWEGLLAGLVAVGVAFSLQDIVDAATVIFDDASSLIQAAA